MNMYATPYEDDHAPGPVDDVPDLSPPATSSLQDKSQEVSPEPAPDTVTIPVAQESFDYAKFAQEFGKQMAQHMPQAAPISQQERDWNEYWMIDPEDPRPGETLHRKIEQRFEEKNKALLERLALLETNAIYLQSAKADDKAFSEVRNEAIELINSGQVRDFALAVEIAKGRRERITGAVSAASGGPVPAGRAPRVPVPPKSASTPASTTGAAKAKRPSQVTDIRKMIREDPELRAAYMKVGESRGGLNI